MKLNEIREFLGEDLKTVENRIAAALKSDIGLLDRTNAAILSNSGKLIRPIVSLLIARACSGGRPAEASYMYAAASELLHNATLLHDDVADNSGQRRGRPTVMSLLGPTASVLLGDFWLVKAMESILSAGEDSSVIRIFSATLSDLAEGEMLQLEKAGTGDTSEEDYYRIVYSKTASLFKASAVSAAISVGASERQIAAAGIYAENLGMAFQIRDDIFDYSASADVGKPVGVDILEGKITLPLLGALASVPEEKAREIRRQVCGIAGHPEYRDGIIAFVRENGGIGYAQEKLAVFTGKAQESLSAMADSQDREWLERLALFVGRRNY